MRNDYIKIARGRRSDFLLREFKAGIDTTMAEETLPLSVAYNCYNFDFTTSTLRQGYGISAISADIGKLESKVSAVWVFRRYDFELSRYENILMFSTLEGKVFYYPCDYSAADEAVELEGVQLTGIPRAVNYRLYGEDVILICTDSDAMVVWDGIHPAYSVLSSPLITSLAIHFERMFVTVAGQGNAVYFSDDLNPTNWNLELDEGGYIELIDERGRLNKVISYLNYIYIFRDYGISRLSAFSDQADFSVSNLFVSSGKIFPDTVCLCGDRVLFQAEDGIYSFDGISTTKILKKLTNLFSPTSKSTAAFIGGKYYLSTTLSSIHSDTNNKEDGEDNNSLLIYDISSGKYSLSKGYDVRKITAVPLPLLHLDNDDIDNNEGEACEDKECIHNSEGMAVVVVMGDGRVARLARNGKLFDQPLEKKWSVPKTDFGIVDKIKHVKNIFLFSRYDVDIILKTDEQSKLIKVKGRNYPQRIQANISGMRIGADIIATTEKAEISRFMLRITQ